MIAETIQYSHICDLCETKDRAEYWYYLSFVPKAYSEQYIYCRYIKDRPVLWKALIKSAKYYPSALIAAVSYCQYVKDRKELRDTILASDNYRTPEALYLYCRAVKDRTAFWKKLFDMKSSVAYMYQIEYVKHVRKAYFGEEK